MTLIKFCLPVAALSLGVCALSEMSTFPSFSPEPKPQNLCTGGNLATMTSLKNATSADCNALWEAIAGKNGYANIANFKTTNDNEWMALAVYDTCTLAVRPATEEDAKATRIWEMGNADAANLVLQTMWQTPVGGEGSAQGTIQCHYFEGTNKDLYWRIWDAEESELGGGGKSGADW